ncbi:MAG: pilus assembly protein N-terminal domain-containing protein, partial [Alphaproteobacteria bacterium]|nr:pilus assembly protein N-terminal domain-containing protein [Alphaproteobacteria bacterium]
MVRKLLNYIAFAVLSVGALALTESVYAADANSVAKSKPKELLTLSMGKADVVRVGPGVTDVLVSDPDIVEVGPVKNDQLYLIGSAVGDTNVLVFGKSGDLIKQISVHVKADTSKLEESLKTLFPNENIVASSIGDKITLSGTVSNADVAARAADLAGRFVTGTQTVVNNISVRDNQQVMIHVKIVEVARNVLNELGLETDIAGLKSGNFAGQHSTSSIGTYASANAAFNGGPLAGNPAFGLTVDPSFGNGALIYDTGSTGPISLVIHALERDGLVNTLA